MVPGLRAVSEIDMFAVNQDKCTDCKRLLDRIAKQVERQGESAWLAQQKRCPKRMKAMLDHFRALIIKAGGTTKKQVKFAVADFREYQKTEQANDYTERGRLMWESQVFRLACSGMCCKKDSFSMLRPREVG